MQFMINFQMMSGTTCRLPVTKDMQIEDVRKALLVFGGGTPAQHVGVTNSKGKSFTSAHDKPFLEADNEEVYGFVLYDLQITIAQIDWTEVCEKRDKECHILALRDITVEELRDITCDKLTNTLKKGDLLLCPQGQVKDVQASSMGHGPLCITFFKNPTTIEPYRRLEVDDATLSFTFATGMEAWLGAEVMKSPLFGTYQLDGEAMKSLPLPEGEVGEFINVGWEDDERWVGVLRGFLTPAEVEEVNREAATAPWTLTKWGVRKSNTQKAHQRRNANFSGIVEHQRDHSHIGGSCGTMLMNDSKFPKIWKMNKKVATFLQFIDPADLICEGNAYEHSNPDAAIKMHGDSERGAPGFVFCVRAGGKALDIYFCRRVGNDIEKIFKIHLNPGDAYIMPGETLGYHHSTAARQGKRNIVHGVYRGKMPVFETKKNPEEDGPPKKTMRVGE